MKPTLLNLLGSDLSDDDYRRLAARSIGRETADAAGIRRVDSLTGSEMFGRKRGNLSGIIIPNVWPGADHVREYRERLDTPELERKPDGSVREVGKYIQPPGRANLLYFPPGVAPEALEDVSVPFVVTEGEFKAVALWQASHHAMAKPRFIPLSIAGVWNWRGSVGKTVGQRGDRRDVKGPIPDLDRIAWKSRRVAIAFDADSDQNRNVRAARTALAAELENRGPSSPIWSGRSIKARELMTAWLSSDLTVSSRNGPL
jgi:hypothetical protein